MKRYYEIIEHFGLQEEFATYLKSKSIDAPYHNLWHTINMIEDCYDAYVYLKGNDKGCKDLIIAAIFHDIDHSQGKHTDDINIKAALERVEALPYDKTEVINIIKVTQYPYVIPAEELSLNQAIIRDADLMSSFKNTFLPHCAIGLSKEMKMDLNKMFDGQEKFIEGCVWNTQWGHENYIKNINNLKKELKFLKSLNINK